MGRAYEVAPVPVAVADDSAMLARGEHVAAIRGCADCHGEDMGGGVFLDEMPVARLPASNLTSGAGGVASRYRTDASNRGGGARSATDLRERRLEGQVVLGLVDRPAASSLGCSTPGGSAPGVSAASAP